MGEKQEILERVLLLMKYDNKTTLTENLKILNEQTGSMVQPNLSTSSGKGSEFKPKLKEYDGFFGKLKLPETAKVTLYPDGIKFMSDGKDGKGNYVFWEKLSKKYGLPSDYSFKDTSGRQIELKPTSKIYTPNEQYLSQYEGKVTRFTIPKGTLVPKKKVTEYFDNELDKWEEVPLEENIEFKIVVNITIEKNIYEALNPNPSNPMNGYTLNKGYFFLDKNENKYVSYSPKTWIEFRSPEKVWWDNYGLWIEIAGSVVITVLSSGLLGPALASYLGTEIATTGLVADGILNGIFNLGIARFHFANDDNKSGTLSVVIAFLPLLIRSNKTIASIMKIDEKTAITYCNEIIESLNKNFSNLGDDPKLWQKWFDSLSDGAKDVVKNIDNIPGNEIDEGMKFIVGSVKDTISKLPAKTILQRIFSKSAAKVVSKFIGEFVIVGAEIHQIMKIIESVTGPLSPEEQVVTLSYIAEVNNENEGKKTPQQYADDFLSLSKEEQTQILDSANKVSENEIHEITVNLQKTDSAQWLKYNVPDSVYWNSRNFDDDGNPTEELLKRYPFLKDDM